MNDTLRLLNGCLSLSYPNNYNRTLTFSGNGDLVTTSNGYLWMKRVITNSYPGIKVYTNHGLTSALRFHPDNYYLYLLDINTTKPVKLATTLMVKTGLLLSSMLDIQGNKLIAEYLTSFRFSKSAYINMAPGAQFEHDAWNREIFPVGAGGYYSPVVARQNATGYSPWQSISLVDTIYEHGDTGNIWSSSKPCVRRTWKFDGTHFNRIHPYVRISWPGAMEANGFDRNNAYIAFYDSATSKWTKGSNCQKAVLDTNGLWSVEVTNIPTGHFIILDTNTALTVNGPAISQQSQFKLYPNPATNVLHVEGNTLANADAQIINAMGQKIKTITLQKGNNTISIAELPAGNYWLRLGEESRQFTKR